jgi:hypothetical protein
MANARALIRRKLPNESGICAIRAAFTLATNEYPHRLVDYLAQFTQLYLRSLNNVNIENACHGET